MTLDSFSNPQEVKPNFNIGEIVEARDRLWRIDQIHKEEKNSKIYIYYSVSNITGQPSSQILIPDIEPIKKSLIPVPSTDKTYNIYMT